MTMTVEWEQQTELEWVALEERLTTWLENIPPDETVTIGLAWEAYRLLRTRSTPRAAAGRGDPSAGEGVRVVGTAPLRAPSAGLWRARRGEYRVRYQIDDGLHRVVVVDVDHGRDVYRR